MSRAQSRAFWILITALLLLTRLPVAAKNLSIDNVNLAFALDHFDPRIHQPQPPGYPFFVFFARIMNIFLRDPERTFLMISVLVSGLCLPLIYALARRMFDPWVGKAAVVLLLFNPVFWHAGLDGPLRPNLALFSLLAAYCAWRAWNGEERYVVLGAIAVGVGSGVRPDLMAYLLPLWFISAWAGTRSPKSMVIGAGVLGVVVALWVGGLIYAVGSVAELRKLFENYAVEQSQGESVVLGSSLRAWLHQVNRLIIWNGLAVVEWLWALPFFLWAKERIGMMSKQTAFFIVWLVPGLIVQALIHVAAPGHTLSSVPAFCLIGGYVLSVALKRWEAADAGLLATVSLNVMLFLGFVTLPVPGSTGGVLDAIRVGTFESSLAAVRWLDDIEAGSLAEIRDLAVPGKRIVIVGQDAQRKDWFLNWRIARYYYPDADIRVVADLRTPPFSMEVRGQDVSPARTGDPIEVRVPSDARIVWLIERDSVFHSALKRAVPVQNGRQVFYSDIGEETPSFEVMNFRFVPDHGI